MLVVNSGFEEGKSGESAFWKYHDDLTGKKFQRPFHPSVHSEGDAQESLNADLSHSRGNVGCQSEPRNSVRVEIDNLAAMLDCSPIPTLMISCGRDVVIWNRACEVLTHVPKEHVLGKPLDFRHFFNGRCLPVLANLLLEGNKEEILQHVRRGVVQYNPYLEMVECKGYIQVGGDRKILRMSATKMKDGQGRLLGAVQYAQDITREERIQKHLEYAQKMESLGALAGAMVHEFNNLLLAIQGYSELMLQKMDSQHPLKRYIVTIDSTCQKAAGMARSMLDFARRGERKVRPVNINHLLEEMRELLNQLITPAIKLEMELQENMASLMADAGQLKQIMINLVVNAKDAMPAGGRICIRSSVREICENLPQDLPCSHGGRGAENAGCTGFSSHRRFSTIRPGRYVEVEVEDTGAGISRDLLDKIFDPFVTTKKEGRGTGLGLFVVSSIVEAHKGNIVVESEPGRGSLFRLFFPIGSLDLFPEC